MTVAMHRRGCAGRRANWPLPSLAPEKTSDYHSCRCACYNSTSSLSNYENCVKSREQIKRMFPEEGDKTYKCQELKTYLAPAKRYKAAERQGLVQNYVQTIRSGLKDPGSYRFKDRPYIATADNGLDIRVTYMATNSFVVAFKSYRPASTPCDQKSITLGVSSSREVGYSLTASICSRCC